MDRVSGLKGTVVVSVFTLCCSTVCCATGIYAVADHGRLLHLGPSAGIPMVLLGIVVWMYLHCSGRGLSQRVERKKGRPIEGGCSII